MRESHHVLIRPATPTAQERKVSGVEILFPYKTTHSGEAGPTVSKSSMPSSSTAQATEALAERQDKQEPTCLCSSLLL